MRDSFCAKGDEVTRDARSIALYGMRVGGYWEVQVSPHLGYGDADVPDIIPPQALLRIQLWAHVVH